MCSEALADEMRQFSPIPTLSLSVKMDSYLRGYFSHILVFAIAKLSRNGLFRSHISPILDSSIRGSRILGSNMPFTRPSGTPDNVRKRRESQHLRKFRDTS